MSLKNNRKLKIILIILAALVVLASAGAISLMFLAKNAASDFRSGAAKQLNNVIAGKDVGATVELRSVWLGDSLNPDYKKVDSMQSGYNKLLAELKSYVSVLDLHNQLVAKYNSGLKGENIVNGDLLKLVNKCRDLIASKFPDEKDRVTAMNDLSQRVSDSSDFQSVEGFISTVISDNEGWLNDLREDLNVQIADFQKKIN